MARRAGGLYRRRQFWYFKYKTAAGIWKETTTHRTNYHDAVKVRANFLRELEQGNCPTERSKWTLQQATSEWLLGRALRTARSTHFSEKTITRNLLRLLGAETKLINLSDIHIVKGYETMRLARGINPKTVNNEIQILASILREANLWHRIAAHYKPLRVPKSDVAATLTRGEAARLLRYAKSAALGAVAPFAAVLSFATGLRTREIKNLKLGSIQIEEPNPHLYVRRSTTKTDSGARYVALDKLACWAIGKLLARAEKLGATLPDHFLLPTQLEKHTRKTDPLHGGSGFDVNNPQSSWDQEWGNLRKRVGIVNRRFHDLRHSYVTRAAEAGVPLAVTQAQVGHMSVQMIQHYTHICQPAIHHAARLIENTSADLLSIVGISAPGHTGENLRSAA